MAFNTGATKNVQPNQNIDIESTAPQSRTSTYDLSKANHPVICFLSIAFRVAAILWSKLKKKI